MPRPPVPSLLRASLRGLTAPVYPPEARGVARMDANTNLLGPNPAVRKAARRLGALETHQYPTGNSDRLRDALAARWKVDRANVIVGHGSDELFDLVTKAFVDPGDRVAFPVPSFVMYPFYARVNGGRPVGVPLLREIPNPKSQIPTNPQIQNPKEGRGSPPPRTVRPASAQGYGGSAEARRGEGGGGRPPFALDVDGLLRTRAKVTLLATPNNPTGNAFPAEAIERVVRKAVGIVVVDEAYAEFCGQDWIARIGEFDNLLVTRTFSKAFGLAGLRVGYAVGPAPLVEALLRVKPPFNVGAFGEAVALAALADRRFVAKSVRVIRSERVRVAEALEAMGAAPFPSDANFLLVDVRRPAREVADALARKRIGVRAMTDFPGLDTCIRVTLGPREMNDRFLGAMRGALK